MLRLAALTTIAACASAPVASEDLPVYAGQMVSIAGGLFTMGSVQGEPDEAPARQVRLPGFEIDRYEVAVGAFDLCVDAGVCRSRVFTERADLSGERQPVVGVSWYDASRYCKWVGKRLPSEAEWERAARGAGGGIYPWGNDEAAAKANLRGQDDRYAATAPIDTMTEGRSAEGVLHMAGNVAEWVDDAYDPTVYKRMEGEAPPAPREGRSRVVRVGSYRDVLYSARGSSRDRRDPGSRWDTVGFRCAR